MERQVELDKRRPAVLFGHRQAELRGPGIVAGDQELGVRQLAAAEIHQRSAKREEDFSSGSASAGSSANRKRRNPDNTPGGVKRREVEERDARNGGEGGEHYQEAGLPPEPAAFGSTPKPTTVRMISGFWITVPAPMILPSCCSTLARSKSESGGSSPTLAPPALLIWLIRLLDIRIGGRILEAGNALSSGSVRRPVVFPREPRIRYLAAELVHSLVV